jgi:hypothetical protein
LTREGCEEACGTGSDAHDVLRAFQVLTTWVLPAVSLLSQLPYESLSRGKRKNVEAFVSWVGAPASALTTTIFNIWIVRKAKGLVGRAGATNDACYVLCCINQYEYPYEGDTTQRRDEALLFGLLRPGSNKTPSEDMSCTKDLLTNLAFQVRLQRRRAVLPLSINVIWFLVAVVISIVISFANLGDNSTAHSLALGLLISWLPILVVMSTVDRNPVNAGRCKVLIECWLRDVDRELHNSNFLSEQQVAGSQNRDRRPHVERQDNDQGEVIGNEDNDQHQVAEIRTIINIHSWKGRTTTNAKSSKTRTMTNIKSPKIRTMINLHTSKDRTMINVKS